MNVASDVEKMHARLVAVLDYRLTDYEVVASIREHARLIGYFASRESNAYRLDFDDCMQEASIAFWTAARTWRSTGGSSLKTYAARQIRYGAINRKRNRAIKKRTAHVLSVEERTHAHAGRAIIDELRSEDDPFDAIEERIDRHRMAMVMVNRIAMGPESNLDVIIRRYWGDETLDEVGQSRGVTRQRAKQIEARALETARPLARFLTAQKERGMNVS